MPTQRYALESGGDKRLEVSWKGFWKNLTVKLDGNVIGTVAGQKELKAGQGFELPDGSVLSETESWNWLHRMIHSAAHS